MTEKEIAWLNSMKKKGWAKKTMLKFPHEYLSESDDASYYDPGMIGSDFPYVDVWTQEDGEICYEGDEQFITACYEEE